MIINIVQRISYIAYRMSLPVMDLSMLTVAISPSWPTAAFHARTHVLTVESIDDVRVDDGMPAGRQVVSVL